MGKKLMLLMVVFGIVAISGCAVTNHQACSALDPACASVFGQEAEANRPPENYYSPERKMINREEALGNSKGYFFMNHELLSR
jgi:hypothetical protein